MSVWKMLAAQGTAGLLMMCVYHCLWMGGSSSLKLDSGEVLR